jgi:oxalate decarboxylase/phosphoglucose isomerase-like protein (cupin superfamily)
MATDKQRDGSAYTRRELLGAASLTAAGLATASLVAAPAAGAAPSISSPDDRLTIAGGDPLKQDPSLDAANPDSLVPPATDHGDVMSFKYPFSFGRNRVQAGGWARQVTVRDLPVSTDLAGVNMRLTAGGIRELHWHPNANEWQYYISGKARMTVFAAGGRARTMDFDAGDVGYVQRAMGHYVENTGDTDLRFLEMFKSDRYEDISLAEWMSHTPPELVAQHLHVDLAMLESIPKKEMTVVPV